MARPTSGRDGAIWAGLSIKIEIVPIVKEASAKVEKRKRDTEEGEADWTKVGLVAEGGPTDENSEKAI